MRLLILHDSRIPQTSGRVTWASYNQCRNLVLPENVCFNAFYLEPFLLSELGLITPAGEACGPATRDAASRRRGCSPWQGQERLCALPRAPRKSLMSPLLQGSRSKCKELGFLSPKCYLFPQKRASAVLWGICLQVTFTHRALAKS